MSTYTMFLSPQVMVFPTSTPDPFFTEWVDGLIPNLRYNVAQKWFFNCEVDDGDAQSLSFGPIEYDNRWMVVVARVVGEGYLTIRSGSGPDTAKLMVYGTEQFPGFVVTSVMYRNGSFAFTGTADGTVCDLMVALAEEDA